MIQSIKLSQLIKECRAEMRNDLNLLHNALNVQNKDMSVMATKSSRVSSKKLRLARKLLSSTTSHPLTVNDYFYQTKAHSTIDSKRRQFSTTQSSSIKTRKIRVTRHKNSSPSTRQSFTYKHYDLYLLTKNPVEACRNASKTSTLGLKKNLEYLSVEKSHFKGMDETLSDNQTIFEPKFSSSPIHREQKTSTPTKNRPEEDKPMKIRLSNASRFKFLNSTNFQTFSTTTSQSIQPNLQSFEYNQNTSTPKVARRNVNGSVENGTTMAFKECAVDMSENFCLKNLSSSTDSNVSTVIKCCIQPLKNLIRHRYVKRNNRHKKL